MPHPKPITFRDCQICERLSIEGLPKAVVGDYIPQKSLNHINQSPIHNWYFFTLGYSPKFVDYIIKSKKISKKNVILDPFVGSGTTIVEAKLQGIKSLGIDANDFMVFASKVKANWNLDVSEIKVENDRILRNVQPIISFLSKIKNQRKITDFVDDIKHTDVSISDELLEIFKRNYISEIPIKKIIALRSEIDKVNNQELQDLFRLALSSIMVPSSNIKYGPGFGIGKIKEDVDVIKLFSEKMARIINDIEFTKTLGKTASSSIYLGDSRNLTKFFDEESIDYMITSPPYPGEHEYTKHTRLELALMKMAASTSELREIKQRMIRSGTLNIYHTDKEVNRIRNFEEIKDIMDKIDHRIVITNGTSGFEKLYSRVVGEYFGGMFTFLEELYSVLKENGTASFLVGDSHGFKMVHIETGRLLGELAIEIGFSNYNLELWWNKRSTAHEFYLPEYILNLRK